MAIDWEARLQTGPWLKRTRLRTWLYLGFFESAVWYLYATRTKTESDSSLLFFCTFWTVLPLSLLLELRALFRLILVLVMLAWPILVWIIPWVFASAMAQSVAQSTYLAILTGVATSLLIEICRQPDEPDRRKPS